MGMLSFTSAPKEEKRIFERLKKDPSVIGELYDLYAKELYGFLVKRCGHKETAEDLVGHVFIKLLESSSKLEWRGIRMKSWLYTVASNALTDHFRKAGNRMASADESEVEDVMTDDDPSLNAEIVIEGEKLVEVMKSLSDRDQEVLDLRFFAGMEPLEIGQTLGVSANHASVLVYRALSRLRKKAVLSASSANDTSL
jgi:RNA polymerase sigma-70 factor (ECF subfamily)